MSDNPRDELYRSFRRSLSRPVSERFFDEDELVELYDYAGDLNDDYVQMEVLFCGARLYPESAALAERRALLYLDTTVDDSDRPSPATAAFLEDNPELTSPLFDITRLEVNRPSQPVEALEFLLSQYDTFNDEEIIRFVDLAFDLDQYEWVKENLGRLRKKVKYEPVLIYEVMQEADDRTDNEFVAALAEELIEGEPFSVGYWATLFKAQARAGKEEEARQTFDYAKALGADSPDALLVLCDTIYNFAPYLYGEALELLETLSAENPDEFMYTDCRCAILVRVGASDKAIRALTDFVKAHPAHVRAMRQLLLCNLQNPGQYLDPFYEATGGQGFDAETYAELVGMLSMNSASRSLNALLSHHPMPEEMEPSDFCAWIEALFALGRYERIATLVSQYHYRDVLLQIPLKGLAFAFAYMVSLMKLGRQDDCLSYYADIRPTVEAILSDAPMPVKMIARCLVTLEDKIRQHPADDHLYWEYFDMLSYGKF